MPASVNVHDIPQGKYRAVERLVKKSQETLLGDFDSLEDAEKHVKDAFRAQKPGWYGYSVYNDKGVRIFMATATKKKMFFVTKTHFVSETYSIR